MLVLHAETEIHPLQGDETDLIQSIDSDVVLVESCVKVRVGGDAGFSLCGGQ